MGLVMVNDGNEVMTITNQLLVMMVGNDLVMDVMVDSDE